MAGALSPEQRWALIERYGTLDNAVQKARMRSPELQKLWNSQVFGSWSGHAGDFWKAWWKLALPVLGIETAPPLEDGEAASSPPPRAARGRDEAGVSEDEANRAARIYIGSGELTPYEVWTRYNPRKIKQAEKPELLSRHMVEYLVKAIVNGWLSWDPAEGRLRISDEFRTSQTTFVIPRRKPDS